MITDLVNVFDYEAKARELLAPAAYDYIAGGAADEVSLGRPRVIFDALMLRPRVMVDVGSCDASTTVLGDRVPFPIMVAPSGDHGIVHAEGELATARGVGAIRTVMVVSSGSTFTLEDIAKRATGPLWFHMPLLKDKGLASDFIRRAECAGYRAICLTVDHKVLAKRERNIRNRWSSKTSPNFAGLDLPDVEWARDTTARHSLFDELLDLSATWSYVNWLVSVTRLPVVAKGVLTALDALQAVDSGVSAVVVSDHGGRQLDTTIAPIEALPEVVEVVGDRAEVYLDGGIRRGTDVLKALAFGARAVLVGRPVLWGLAVAGERGVRSVLDMLRDEFEAAMAMCGRPTLSDIDRSLVISDSPLTSAYGGGR